MGRVLSLCAPWRLALYANGFADSRGVLRFACGTNGRFNSSRSCILNANWRGGAPFGEPKAEFWAVFEVPHPIVVHIRFGTTDWVPYT